jgi:hypothetical protein
MKLDTGVALMAETDRPKSAKEMLKPVLGSEADAVLDVLTGSVEKIDAMMAGLQALRQEIIDSAKRRLRLKTSFWPDVSPTFRRDTRVSWIVFDKDNDGEIEFRYSFSKQGFTLGDRETLTTGEQEVLRQFRYVLPPCELETLSRLQKRYDGVSRKKTAA